MIKGTCKRVPARENSDPNAAKFLITTLEGGTTLAAFWAEDAADDFVAAHTVWQQSLAADTPANTQDFRELYQISTETQGEMGRTTYRVKLTAASLVGTLPKAIFFDESAAHIFGRSKTSQPLPESVVEPLPESPPRAEPFRPKLR